MYCTYIFCVLFVYLLLLFCSYFVILCYVYSFVCTSVGLLPLGESPIAVRSGGGGGGSSSSSSFRRQFPHKIRPIQLAFFLIVCRVFLSFLTLCTINTSFLTRSVELISSLLQQHILKCSRYF
jgi:hypothetical protein